MEDVEGVTRDRLYEVATVFGREVRFVDTGGIAESGSTIAFSEEIRVQTMKGISDADAVIMVVDSRCGPTLQDEEVAHLLLKQNKPIYLAVNKVDNPEEEISAFYSLGLGRLFPVSALHGRGVADLLEAAVPETVTSVETKDLPKVAIVGRPNVGKSTLMNCLLDEERCLVSDIPGTTRDAVDVEMDGCIFIDTAGIRKKKSEPEVVDKFAAIRTEKIIERCDICILMLDVNDGLTAHEKLIAKQIEEQGKGCIIFLNKWDQVQGFRMEHSMSVIRATNPFLAHTPIIVGSAKTGRGVDKIVPTIFEVKEQMEKRITTGELNTFLERAIQLNHPPLITGKRLRIYYLTQVGIKPPHFVLFVNEPKLLVESYRRYLVGKLREQYHFLGAPLAFKLNRKKQLSRHSTSD